MNHINQLITENASLSDEALAKEIDSFLKIHTEEIQTDGKDTFHCHRYEPTPYRVLHTLAEEMPLTDNDILLDYGSGLGRLSFYCHHAFHCGTIGVEMVTDFHNRALENLENYQGAGKEVLAFVNESAEDYEIPDDVTVIYCFNPFSTAIFRSVLNQIEASYERHQREITLILYYPEDDTIFYIERHTPFRLVREIAASDDIIKDRRERFCIYRL